MCILIMSKIIMDYLLTLINFRYNLLINKRKEVNKFNISKIFSMARPSKIVRKTIKIK